MQIRDRKLLLMQKAPLFFTLKYITYNKECRGFIILYSRYFSPWQDTELVAINLQMCVNALYKIFSCCLLRLLTAASTEVDKIVALSFFLKKFQVLLCCVFLSLHMLSQEVNQLELLMNDTSDRCFPGDWSNLCFYLHKFLFKWQNR